MVLLTIGETLLLLLLWLLPVTLIGRIGALIAIGLAGDCRCHASRLLSIHLLANSFDLGCRQHSFQIPCVTHRRLMAAFAGNVIAGIGDLRALPYTLTVFIHESQVKQSVRIALSLHLLKCLKGGLIVLPT